LPDARRDFATYEPDAARHAYFLQTRHPLFRRTYEQLKSLTTDAARGDDFRPVLQGRFHKHGDKHEAEGSIHGPLPFDLAAGFAGRRRMPARKSRKLVSPSTICASSAGRATATISPPRPRSWAARSRTVRRCQRRAADLADRNLISRGVDVIVIVPFNEDLGNVVAEAKKAGIKVVSYDRLILNADVDAYISFDNEKVGEMQAQAWSTRLRRATTSCSAARPTDNNAKMLREGQLKVLKPLVDQGRHQDRRPAMDAGMGLPRTRCDHEDALTANNNNIQAIVASNDGTAGGAIQALAGAEAGRQGGRVRPGCRSRRRQTRQGRHADHDGLQAAQTDRHRGGQPGGRSGERAAPPSTPR
jgi:hypothetical protein